MHGIILARDASQQVLSGRLIDEIGDFREALPVIWYSSVRKQP